MEQAGVPAGDDHADSRKFDRRIVEAARETVHRAGVAPSRVQALYFTGGSTGLSPLVRRLQSEFAHAQPVHGDHFASVAQGLGVHAGRVYGGA